MLHKFLIFLLLFNAIIPTAFAMQGASGCGMVMEESSKSTIPSYVMAMDCEMTEKPDCSISQCAANCTSSISPLILYSQEQLPLSIGAQICPYSGLAYFYSIIYPVSTPPPNVIEISPKLMINML